MLYDSLKCPFQKVITQETDIWGKKTTEVAFGDCDWRNCMAAKKCKHDGKIYFDYCRLLKEKEKHNE